MKIVLAYSGGLDTSIILKWLIEHYGAEVIAFTADIGQGEEVEEARVKALRTGAIKAQALDLREEFVRDFVFPMFRSGALYEGYYLLGTSIARPLIAKHLVRIAQEEGAEAIAHGATGKGNDQVRFELTAYSLKPDIRVIAPWREWEFVGRPEMIEYAAKHGIPVPATLEKPYSVDANLLHNSFEGGVLEDPWAEPPEGMFRLTTDPHMAPDRYEYLEVEFVGGNPVAVNGEKLAPAALLAKLNEIGGRNGIGRIDLVENRFVGMKSRGVYETPGGTLLYHARRAVESLTVDREVLHQRDGLASKYAELVYNGFWFAPEREALQSYFDHVAQTVTGTARLKLYRGSVITVGRKSPLSLYDKSLVSFDEKGGYNQADADGFIKLNSLRLRVRAKAQPKD
ncbi:argininosuccinate synthase [Meiothermus granaticius]|uniref:Argininosuccinate synthase n=1 Tax=Meiothermus granaticius NBRC 107808 TaxID=1227551 RepID=A0A399FAC1_9DEIN|nr:argininosuccinate synthase [Meiothermus granaticius]RIH91862.1 Argininosuccinate synthase [Meiothermus granaticius NBRC 107808]GEM87529.1 argininosuccinate synthase [Meiothermus granaticius NBRC 107808]